jgi:hypothetical protein
MSPTIRDDVPDIRSAIQLELANQSADAPLPLWAYSALGLGLLCAANHLVRDRMMP